MPVRQVDDTPHLEPNCVYVIAPDRELVIEGDNIHSRPFSEPRGQRAPIDMFFRSSRRRAHRQPLRGDERRGVGDGPSASPR